MTSWMPGITLPRSARGFGGDAWCCLRGFLRGRCHSLVLVVAGLACLAGVSALAGGIAEADSGAGRVPRAPGTPPTITNQPVGQVVRVGASLTFTVGATGQPVPDYQWLKDGLPIPDAVSTTLAFSPVVLTNAGLYAAVVSNTAGAVTSQVAGLSVWLLDLDPARVPRLTIQGLPGQPYRIDYRDGFVGSWKPLTGFLLTTNPCVFLDYAGKDASSRYYQVYQAPLPRFVGSPRVQGSLVQLTLESEAGRVLEIRACSPLSTNSADWRLLATVTNTAGVLTWQETVSPAQNPRFYKALQVR